MYYGQYLQGNHVSWKMIHCSRLTFHVASYISLYPDQESLLTATLVRSDPLADNNLRHAPFTTIVKKVSAVYACQEKGTVQLSY